MSSNEPALAQLEPLLDHLRRTRGVDLGGYRLPPLIRRIHKRMQDVQVDSVQEYLDYLEAHSEEFPRLFDSILINVTSFFRDPEAWDMLAREVIPAIVANKPGNDPIRVWSAGCASGEEAFTLAMLWAENLGIEQYRQRMKIYATDVDDNALAIARLGQYDAAQLEIVPDDLRSRNFERAGQRHALRADLRRAVIFGRHDLIKDPPISRLDLLVCRNTLIYLNSDTQSRILARFHFALTPGGFLFLGKAETLLSHTGLFRPVDLRHRVFSRTARVDARDHLLALVQAGDPDAIRRLAGTARLTEEALSCTPVAQIVLDSDGTLVVANQFARDEFELRVTDLGRSFDELELAGSPLELRPLVHRVQAERAPLKLEGVERARPRGGVQVLDVQVTPLVDERNALLGVSIVLDDVTRARHLLNELARLSRELEASNEELQSTNEELLTTNQELQSTVAELETANEELQSTNEEHETMNEELQMTNQELGVINQQLRSRTEALDRTSILLQTVLNGLTAGVIVVDASLTVLAWNRGAEDLWGLRADETCGRPLMQMDIGLPLTKLHEPLRACLGGSAAQQGLRVEATDRRGRVIVCRVTLSPLVCRGTIQGAIIGMEPER